MAINENQQAAQYVVIRYCEPPQWRELRFKEEDLNTGIWDLVQKGFEVEVRKPRPKSGPR